MKTVTFQVQVGCVLPSFSPFSIAIPFPTQLQTYQSASNFNELPKVLLQRHLASPTACSQHLCGWMVHTALIRYLPGFFTLHSIALAALHQSLRKILRAQGHCLTSQHPKCWWRNISRHTIISIYRKPIQETILGYLRFCTFPHEEDAFGEQSSTLEEAQWDKR